MKVIKVRSYRSERESVGIDFPEPSLAVQASKDECDINVIVAKYLRTGELPGVRQGVYADMTQMTGLQEALHLVNAAEQAFMDLPAEIRREFDNDPTKLVAFAADPANQERAYELGLASRPADPVREPGSGPGGVIDASEPPKKGVPPTST